MDNCEFSVGGYYMDSLKVSGITSVKNVSKNFRSGTTTSAVPEQQRETNQQPKKSNINKVVPAVTSAVALASLGITTYVLVKNPKDIKNLGNKIDKLSQEVTNNKASEESAITGVKNSINSIRSGVEQTVAEVKRDVNDNLNRISGELHDVKGAVKSPQVISNMLTRDVEVNGMHMQLASVMHGYGEQEDKLTNQLRTESTRRILGAVKPITPPETIMLRVPTAEFQGLTKTGGLAVVPRELIANLGAVINNKQKAELLVDTPMYLGQVENKAFLDLKKVGDNKYNYVKKVIEKEDDPTKDKETILATLRKIDDMDVEIYTDIGKTTERVGVYLSDEMKQAVSYEETINQFDEKTSNIIKKKLASGENYETELVKFTAPKQSTSRVELTDGTKIEVSYHKAISQLPDEEIQKIKEYHSIGKDYELTIDQFVNNDGNQLKIFDDATAGKIGKNMDAARIAQERAIQEATKSNKDPKKVKVPVIKFVAPQPAKAEVKFRTVLYDNKKFHMDGPKVAGLDKNIYNNHTTQAGETERNVYFCKYMYENMTESHRHADKPLRADWIIGNDWHTGPLSAMLRLLTPARKVSGQMDPRFADNLYNTPTTTLMHNFKLSGQVWHSQPKLLNIMFGEHAAKVTENAWMPQRADMPGELMNGLFSKQALNPQTMAMSYSDDIVFVSRGNFEEAAKIREKGGDNYALASMRGRTWQYGTREKIDEIAMAASINPAEVPNIATAKGITNGCDRVNNIITKSKARKLEEQLNMRVGSLISDDVAINDPFKAHQNNKREYLLQRVIPDIDLARNTKGAENPMKIYDPETTDLTGVDENTMVYGMAGRIVDQKGIDIWVRGIKERMARGGYDKENPPVYYIQGTGDEKYMNMFLNVKRELRKTDPKAADRMVAAKLFSEDGRYDGCKMMSDFSNMPSWDEPCGLVHKEIGYTSGSISIDNGVGGLRDGLIPYKRGAGAEANKNANAIFVPFVDRDTHSFEEALDANGKAWADAFETAEEWFHDKRAFANGIKNSYLARHDWLTGKIQEYVEIGKRHGVITESVDSKYQL